MGIFIFLIALIVLILVHEFGHFIVAKKSGVRVDEFGLGFPPKLFGKKYGETEYTFNALPFGGFVKIFGESPDEESMHGPDKARSFVNQPKIKQAAIIVAGVVFNLLFAWALFSVGFMSGMPMSVDSAPQGVSVRDVSVVVTGVQDGTPASIAGLLIGDSIVGLTSGVDELRDVTVTTLQSFISSHGGEDVTINYIRGGEEVTVSLIPQDGIVPLKPAIGIAMDEIGIVSLGPIMAIWESAKMTVMLTGAVIGAFAGLLADVFTGQAELANITGPVGIVGLVGDAAQFGFIYLLSFVAFISINLAVINLFPIPALDGGRLFFLAIETIKGSPINPRIVNATHMIGFALLILLMIVVTYNDIIKLIVN